MDDITLINIWDYEVKIEETEECEAYEALEELNKQGEEND